MPTVQPDGPPVFTITEAGEGALQTPPIVDATARRTWLGAARVGARPTPLLLGFQCEITK